MSDNPSVPIATVLNQSLGAATEVAKMVNDLARSQVETGKQYAETLKILTNTLTLAHDRIGVLEL